ncbi:MAG: Holliday junction branch migration DNA helicase RuvB, partial [Deltaproteobacteria bacterium]|nr:Holliday junction branch migration DNA helicase RuvB [Deltaproteobacteria bacterium]
GDLAGLLTNLDMGDILFIDEIHRLHSVVEENLYPAMEDFRFDVIIGEGAHARSVGLNIKPFTLVGATTKTGLLTSPLRDRFGFATRLEFYSSLELSKIIKRSASILDIEIEPKAAGEIAQRSRGTPRIANRLLRRVRDFAQVLHAGKITEKVAAESLNRLGVQANGLDEMDHKILTFLVQTYEGQPVGLETISAALSESSSTLEDVYEPYLIQEGYLMRTPRGRVATPKAVEAVG